MLSRLSLLAFCFALNLASLARAQSPRQDPPQAQQPTAPIPPPAPANPAPTVQTPAPSTPTPKRHRVFTNEDLEARAHEASFNGGRELLDEVNTCDRTCFDQVARTLGGSYSLDVHWKQALLNAVDKSKEDLSWQALLGEMIAVQAQSCELQMKKKQDMDRFADPRTVTHKELLVDREYEPKFREMTRRINEVSSRANAHIRQVTDPYLASFMRVQLSRVVNATCNIYVTEEPDPPQQDPEYADTPDSDDPRDNE